MRGKVESVLFYGHRREANSSTAADGITTRVRA